MLQYKKLGGGVTLLEIMLVLAIAAMIIVMSVRYYQSASASQRANACLAYLQAVAAAADSLSEATQSYSGITSSEIDAIVPRNEAVCNHQSADTLAQSPNYNIGHIDFQIKLPEQACRLMLPALIASGHWGGYNGDRLDEFDVTCSTYENGWVINYYRAKKF